MDEKLAVLSKCPLFDMMSNQELSLVATLARTRRCYPGELILREGEVGDALFVLVDGEVEVRSGAHSFEGNELASLHPPEVFGEMGLIEKDSRSADVRAKDAAELLWFSEDDLTAFRTSFPNGYTLLIINIARLLSQRLRTTTEKLTRALQAATLTGKAPPP